MFKKLIVFFFLSNSAFIRPMDRNILLSTGTMIPVLFSTVLQLSPITRDQLIQDAPGLQIQIFTTITQILALKIYFSYYQYKRTTDPLARQDALQVFLPHFILPLNWQTMAILKYGELMSILIINAVVLLNRNELGNKKSLLGVGKYFLMTELLPTFWFFYILFHEPYTNNGPA